MRVSTIKLKIKAPLTNKNEVEELCLAGADELFCGIEPDSWRRSCKHLAISQRIGAANFTRMDDLAEAITIAHRHNTKVHIALNAFLYLKEQYRRMLDIVREIFDIGADGIIVADLGLIVALKDNLLRDKDVVVGADAVVFNSSAVNFYKMLGATRIVFPRSMTISEMAQVVRKDADLEYEVFIINDLCFFEDGFCTYCKEAIDTVERKEKLKDVRFVWRAFLPLRGYRGGCRTRFNRCRITTADRRPLGRTPKFTFWENKHIDGCGVCAVYDFRKIGITSLKVLDRNMPTELKVKATRFIKKAVSLLDDPQMDKENFVERCRELFGRAYGVDCSPYDCYYPSCFSVA